MNNLELARRLVNEARSVLRSTLPGEDDWAYGHEQLNLAAQTRRLASGGPSVDVGGQHRTAYFRWTRRIVEHGYTDHVCSKRKTAQYELRDAAWSWDRFHSCRNCRH